MLARAAKRLARPAVAGRRPLSIPVNQVASVLKLNVGNEETAIALDEKMKAMTELMREHDGFEGARVAGVSNPRVARRVTRRTRYVCKTEWAYELSFMFTPAAFGTWGESATRTKVHAFYLEALKDVGIAEDDVYGGARVRDAW